MIQLILNTQRIMHSSKRKHIAWGASITRRHLSPPVTSTLISLTILSTVS